MSRRAFALLLGGWAVSALSAATPEQLADLEAKAEYAYFTEDLRTLELLTTEEASYARSPVPLERYHYAHLEFRLLQVALAARAHERAERAGASCLAALGPALSGSSPGAEELVLAGLCQGLLGMEGRLVSRLAAAQRAEPTNPRVLLGRAWADVLQPPRPPGRARAWADAQAAAAAFDRVTAEAPGSPSWGAADACLLTARAAEARGDAFEARNAYEKCLVLAPDFVAARRGLAALGSARSK